MTARESPLAGPPGADPRAPRREPPRKSTARLLWALFSLFVLYGTTFPFHFNIGWHGFLAAFNRVNWLVLGGRPGDPIISDIVQNILLFMPFGFLGYFSLVYKNSIAKKAAIVAAGTALSIFVECLQLFSATRWPALSDVVFNTLGTLAGLAGGIVLKRSVLGFKSDPLARRFLDSESAFPAMIFVMLTVAGCWQPFDFSLDVGSVWGHVKTLLAAPVRLTRPDDDLITFIRFLLTTLFLCRLLQEARIPRPALAGVVLAGCLGLGLEMTQFIIKSRGPAFQDVVVAMLGAGAGGIVYFFPGFHLRPRVWTLAGMSAIFASAAVNALHPFQRAERYSGFNWVLFLTQYERTTFAALGDFLESAMVFFPLGFLWAYFYPRKRPILMAVASSCLLALTAEALQGFVAGRYSDVTDVFGAALGAFAGGLVLTRGWPAFREYMASDDDRQV